MNVTIARLKGFWQYKDLVKQLVIRDIKLKYRRSFWAICGAY